MGRWGPCYHNEVNEKNLEQRRPSAVSSAEEQPAGRGFWKLSGGGCQALCGLFAVSSPISSHSSLARLRECGGMKAPREYNPPVLVFGK